MGREKKEGTPERKWHNGGWQCMRERKKEIAKNVGRECDVRRKRKCSFFGVEGWLGVLQCCALSSLQTNTLWHAMLFLHHPFIEHITLQNK